jgi:probable H4MPT-linked C1 transfer pathway protein
MPVLGLDIGGANLKAAHRDGRVRVLPFPLWKNPRQLPAALVELVSDMPACDVLAVTMTGELCDCFAGKREGVDAILNAVEAVAGNRRVRIWTLNSTFIDIAGARRQPLQVAAANWLALAAFACRFIPHDGLVIDIGSTTTDIVAVVSGRPAPKALTDPERLRELELVYTGVRRTPLCAVLGAGVAAEFFATTQDVYILLGSLPENPLDTATADGRPATRSAAHARLARMMCADAETCGPDETRKLAVRALHRQVLLLSTAFDHVAQRLPGPPETLVLAGEGEFLARMVLSEENTFRDRETNLAKSKVISLAEKLGPDISKAACAYALTALWEADSK